jgi:hypothetical protein
MGPQRLTRNLLCTGNLRLARKVAPKGERENELLFIIAAQSILAPYALIWPALLKQPAGEILSPRGQPNLFILERGSLASKLG